MDILDGARHTRGSLDTWARGKMRELAARVGVTVAPPSNFLDASPIEARVSHNRWIADCPDCPGAEFVWVDNPLFMCCSCWNGVVGGKWRRVALPANRHAIEAVLKARPIPETRNWSSGESIDDLIAENRQRGLPDRA